MQGARQPQIMAQLSVQRIFVRANKICAKTQRRRAAKNKVGWGVVRNQFVPGCQSQDSSLRCLFVCSGTSKLAFKDFPRNVVEAA